VNDAIEERVRTEFGDDFDVAMGVLRTYGVTSYHAEVDRVRRAILTLAKGDLALLRRETELACTDYRDVLVAAEYPAGPGHDPASELEKGLQLVVSVNFSRPGDEPQCWDDVQAVIRLPSDVLERLGTNGVSSRDDLLAGAREARRVGNDRGR
jgi:hypothetical protein